jgi:hypothetical protein
VGFVPTYKHFSGFGLFLLPSRIHARPPAANANRWALFFSITTILDITMIIFPHFLPLSTTILYECLTTLDNIAACFPDISNYPIDFETPNKPLFPEEMLIEEELLIDRDVKAALEVRKSFYNAIKSNQILTLDQIFHSKWATFGSDKIDDDVQKVNIFPLLQFKSTFGYFNLLVLQFIYQSSLEDVMLFIQLPNSQWAQVALAHDLSYKSTERIVRIASEKPIVLRVLLFPTPTKNLGSIIFHGKSGILHRPIIRFDDQEDSFDPLSSLPIMPIRWIDSNKSEKWEESEEYVLSIPQTPTENLPLDEIFLDIFETEKTLIGAEKDARQIIYSIFEQTKKCLSDPEALADLWSDLDIVANVIEITSAASATGLWLIKLIHKTKKERELSSTNKLVDYYHEIVETLISFFEKVPKARLYEISEATKIPKSILKHLLKGLCFEHEPTCFWKPPSIDENLIQEAIAQKSNKK